MIVMKFGGTSVGSPERMQQVADIITDYNVPVFVVLSAMSGTTNALIQIAQSYYSKNFDDANNQIDALEQKYENHIANLYQTASARSKMLTLIHSVFNTLRESKSDMFSSFEEKRIVAQGEILSTNMFTTLLEERGQKAKLLNALDFMCTDKNAEPDLSRIRKLLKQQLTANADYPIYVTQGFICKNVYGEIDNLQRGGSDHTASLVGAAIDADEIQIWTDIDGMHNNDPRIVEKTDPIRHLSFEEAAELAYFGAKILHPTCVLPAKQANIPVRLKFTMQPSAEGTLINNVIEKGRIKAVAVKDNITVLKVRSSRMLHASAFLHKVFETFEAQNTPIDMIATSEVAVSMSIADTTRLNAIVKELEKYGTVTVDQDMCSICAVGDLDWHNVELEAQVVNAIHHLPIRMISFGGSNYNISIIVRMDDKKEALQCLSKTLFYN